MNLSLNEISSILLISAGFLGIFMALNMVSISQHGHNGLACNKCKLILHPSDNSIKQVNCVPDKE